MKPKQDIQAIMTAIGRRNLQNELTESGKENFWLWIDLRHVCLIGANLRYARLDRIHLYASNLYGANMYRVNLKHGVLLSTILEDAYLGDAQLENVNIQSANLTQAGLKRSHFEKTRNLTWKQLDVAGEFVGMSLPKYMIATPEGYAKAKAGKANLDGVPVPEGFAEDNG